MKFLILVLLITKIFVYEIHFRLRFKGNLKGKAYFSLYYNSTAMLRYETYFIKNERIYRKNRFNFVT